MQGENFQDFLNYRKYICAGVICSSFYGLIEECPKNLSKFFFSSLYLISSHENSESIQYKYHLDKLTVDKTSNRCHKYLN